jgi:ferredoxin
MKRRELLRGLLGLGPTPPEATPAAQAPLPVVEAPSHAPDERVRREALARASAQREQLHQGWGALPSPGRKLDLQALLSRAVSEEVALPHAPLRPPGALPEPELLALCTRCGACAEACPHDAIVPVRAGPLAKTPTLILTHAPCYMCDPSPCIAACEPGALSALAPRAIGIASVKLSRCMAKTGCTICVERCPLEGALTWSPLGMPRVDAALCDGCGLCQHACPAPDNAIIILPRPRVPHDRVLPAAPPAPRDP